jgi:hypothetical protein
METLNVARLEVFFRRPLLFLTCVVAKACHRALKRLAKTSPLRKPRKDGYLGSIAGMSGHW